MQSELAARNWDFEVWFMARSEPNRNWTLEESDFAFPHQFLRGVHWNAANCAWHLNLEIVSRLRRSRPDVLLVSGSWTLPTVWLAALTRTGGAKVFWSESHLDSVQRRGGISNLVRRCVLSRFSSFAVPGMLAREYVEAFARPTHVYELPNLVDPTRFRDRVSALRDSHPAHKEDRERTLLVVARLAPEKGLLQFLRGVRLLSKDERSRLRIVIAGDGPQRRAVQEQALDLGVALPGQRIEDELTTLYAEADGFCLPSLFDPNPLAVIEALWAGLPLMLSSRIGNHPECLIPGQNGFLFDPFSPESIAAAISQWLSLTAEQLKNFAMTSLEIAERAFEPKTAIANFLNQVLERPATSTRLEPSHNLVRRQTPSGSANR